MKQKNTTVEIFKALACISVVLIHVRFPDVHGFNTRCLAGIAVPFFFCLAGYYYINKEEFTFNEKLGKLKNIFNIILLTVASHFILTIFVENLFDPKIRAAFLKYMISYGWERFLITNAPPIYSHFWFLFSLALIYLLIFLFIGKREHLIYIAMTAPILLLAAILLQEFRFLKILPPLLPIKNALAIKAYWVHTIFIRALPFFFLGVLFREYKDKILIFSGKLFSVHSLCFAIILCRLIKIWEFHKFSVAQFYIGDILSLFFIMLLCISKDNLRCKSLEYIGYLSGYIYIYHVILFKALYKLLKYLNISENFIVLWFLPIVVLLLSILVAHCISKMVEQYKYFNKPNEQE